MTKELKDLWVLAAWAVFAMCVTGFVGAWHPKTYTVAQPNTVAVGSGYSAQGGGATR
jgi:hypothetical protein